MGEKRKSITRPHHGLQGQVKNVGMKGVGQGINKSEVWNE